MKALEKKKQELEAAEEKVSELWLVVDRANRKLRAKVAQADLTETNKVVLERDQERAWCKRWEKLVQEMEWQHQGAQRQLISMMQRQSEKIKELRASGGGQSAAQRAKTRSGSEVPSVIGPSRRRRPPRRRESQTHSRCDGLGGRAGVAKRNSHCMPLARLRRSPSS